MIYITLTATPPRIKNLNESIESLLTQTKKPDKIFINIPLKYKRFSETIDDHLVPKFNNKIIEVNRGEDYGPGTKLLGSLNKLKKNSLVILVDDDHVYDNYMIQNFYDYYLKAPNNAYSFYVYPVEKFPVAQGADGFAINTNYLDGIEKFYESIVKNHEGLFLNDDLWISYFLYFIKKNKIFSLAQHLKKDSAGKPLLIYKKRIVAGGLIETYGKNLNEAIINRNKILIKGYEYMKEKTKDLVF